MKRKFCYKEHTSGQGVTLAVCDDDLSGKTLKFGDVDFEVSCEFYGEETADADHMLQLVERARIINAVGKRIVSLLKSENLVSEESVLMIEGVPHVQVISY